MTRQPDRAEFAKISIKRSTIRSKNFQRRLLKCSLFDDASNQLIVSRRTFRGIASADKQIFLDSFDELYVISYEIVEHSGRIMLELVERKANGISWPSCRGQNLESLGKDPKGIFFLRRDRACPREKRWRRENGGLLCSLGQLRCNDSYTPDTVGTWKFHRVSRPR